MLWWKLTQEVALGPSKISAIKKNVRNYRSQPVQRYTLVDTHAEDSRAKKSVSHVLTKNVVKKMPSSLVRRERITAQFAMYKHWIQDHVWGVAVAISSIWSALPKELRLGGLAHVSYLTSVFVHCAKNGCSCQNKTPSKRRLNRTKKYSTKSSLSASKGWNSKDVRKTISSFGLTLPTSRSHFNTPWPYFPTTNASSASSLISEEGSHVKMSTKVKDNSSLKSWSVQVAVKCLLKIVQNTENNIFNSSANSAAQLPNGSVGNFIWLT